MQRRGMNIRKKFLRMIMPALRALPPRTASQIVAGIGRTEYILVPGLRHRFDRAVTRAERYFGCHWDPTAIGLELAGNQIRWRTRDQLLDGRSEADLERLFTITGREHLEHARALGRGVILLGNHFGAHLMPAHWMIRQGYDLRLFMERPNSISKFLNSQFDSDGPLGQRKLFISRRADPSESAGSILRAARILKAGMSVLIASDVRWTGPHTAPAKFLGDDYRFSATWVALAALTGAPVVSVFCRVEPDGTYQLEFLPPFHVPSEAPGNGAAAHWVQLSLEAIEERVRLYPTNSNDYLFWTEPEGAAAERGSSA